MFVGLPPVPAVFVVSSTGRDVCAVNTHRISSNTKQMSWIWTAVVSVGQGHCSGCSAGPIGRDQPPPRSRPRGAWVRRTSIAAMCTTHTHTFRLYRYLNRRYPIDRMPHAMASAETEETSMRFTETMTPEEETGVAQLAVEVQEQVDVRGTWVMDDDGR